MRKILLGSHGKMASGLENTLRLFVGNDYPVTSISAYLDSEDGYLDEIDQFIEGIEDGDEAVIFTDILGGSVNQQVIAKVFASEKKIFVISNMNLPVVISILLHFEPLSDEVILTLIDECKIQLMNYEKTHANETEDDFFG